MTLQPKANPPASVHQRLLNLSKERGEEFNLVLTRFAIERLLYRLGESKEAEQFVVKGASAFVAWGMHSHRPTRDLDLLGHGENSSGHLVALFRRICMPELCDDGLSFDPDSVHAEPIRRGQEYQGQRVRLTAYLGRARIPLQVDVAFGDVVTPPADLTAYPTLLQFPAPEVLVYPKETAIAEKLHAMVILGALNSRVKDFYDLWVLSKRFWFKGDDLARAITATFARRRTELPTSRPVAFSPEFSNRADLQTRWGAFMRRNGLAEGELAFTTVVETLHDFLMPVLEPMSQGVQASQKWPPGGPWHSALEKERDTTI